MPATERCIDRCGTLAEHAAMLVYNLKQGSPETASNCAAHALPATHESSRPTAPTRQSALCVPAAAYTACAAVVFATARPPASIVAASRHALPVRHHWPSARPPASARNRRTDPSPGAIRFAETARRRRDWIPARSCHAAGPGSPAPIPSPDPFALPIAHSSAVDPVHDSIGPLNCGRDQFLRSRAGATIAQILWRL